MGIKIKMRAGKEAFPEQKHCSFVHLKEDEEDEIMYLRVTTNQIKLWRCDEK
jgi:hypothetical protein